VTAPTRRGFGSVVLQSSVERQLQGEVHLDWRTEGLICELSLPADEVVTKIVGARNVPMPSAAHERRPAAGARAMRVLVVEDEALVAAQIEDVLTESGHKVEVASRLADAFDRLYRTPPDAALLDINVAGERSYPLAELLVSKGIPFAFCSGYGEGVDLPDHLKRVPMVAKPFDPVELVRAVVALRL